jgi:hypothetical protein
MEAMRQSGISKPVVWRWQERFMREGVDRLLRDKTRPPIRVGTMTHDYKRHGTTTLFAALDVLKARSSGAACSGTAIRRFRWAKSSMRSSIITHPTSTQRCAPNPLATRWV